MGIGIKSFRFSGTNKEPWFGLVGSKLVTQKLLLATHPYRGEEARNEESHVWGDTNTLHNNKFQAWIPSLLFSFVIKESEGA